MWCYYGYGYIVSVAMKEPSVCVHVCVCVLGYHHCGDGGIRSSEFLPPPYIFCGGVVTLKWAWSAHCLCWYRSTGLRGLWKL